MWLRNSRALQKQVQITQSPSFPQLERQAYKCDEASSEANLLWSFWMELSPGDKNVQVTQPPSQQGRQEGR